MAGEASTIQRSDPTPTGAAYNASRTFTTAGDETSKYRTP